MEPSKPKKKRKKPGRKPEAGRARTSQVLVHCLPSERTRWSRAAKAAGMSRDAWMRMLANNASERT